MLIAVVVGSLIFAFVLGAAISANATSALIGSRTATYGQAVTFSCVFHVVGVLVSGTAVAVTIAGLIDVPADDVAQAFAAASLASIAFTTLAVTRGLPISAGYALVGGLTGAGVAAAGWGAIQWGGFHGLRPYGVLGVLCGLILSPVLGVGVAWLVRTGVGRGLRRATPRMIGPVRGGIWLGSAMVATADGVNDGQKSMGLIAGALVAAGSIDSFSVPLWARIAVGVSLALGTAIGGRRIIRTVGRGLYRGKPLDGLSSQVSSASVILGAAFLGAPVSTTNVCASTVVGVGMTQRLHHIRWGTVGRMVAAWILTVPVSAVVGAGIYAALEVVV